LNDGNKELQHGWIYRRGIPEGVSYGPLDASAGQFTRPLAQLLLDAARVFSVPPIREVVADCKETVGCDYDKAHRPLEERGPLADKEVQALADLLALRPARDDTARRRRGAAGGAGGPVG
jgi:hypothetical protein